MPVPHLAEPTRVLKTSLSDKNEAELKATLSTHSRSEARSLQLIEPDPGDEMFRQLLTPVGDSLGLSFLIAILPVVAVLVLLGLLRRPAWQAASV
jgi:hypothetical protein